MPQAPVADRSTADAPREAVQAEHRAERPGLLDWLALATVWLSCAIALSPRAAEADLWGHVRYGQDVLASGQLPRTATYTYTAVGHRWINHENLAELCFAAIATWAGGPGLLVFKCLLGLGLLALVAQAVRRQEGSFTTLALVLVLVSINLTADWTVRPQIFSFAFFGVLVCLLDEAFSRWPDDAPRLRWLWAIPPLFAVWANTHGGFLAGLAVFWAYVGLRSVGAAWRRSPGAARVIAKLAAVGVAGGLATLLTPYGLALPRWLFESLRVPRPEIFEWRPLHFSDGVILPFALLTLVAAAALIGTRRKRDWVQVALLAATLWQAIAHERHIPFFALLVGFWLPGHIESLRRRLLGAQPPAPLASRPNGLLVLAFSAACAALAGLLGTRLSALVVERGEFPVSALEYLADRGLHGRALVNFNWAQYFLAARGERSSVQFDGRYDTCYPWSSIDAHFDWLLGDVPGGRQRHPSSGPVDPTRALREGPPDLVLLDRNYAHAVDVLAQQQADWVLLYQDGLAQLWGRRDRYGEPAGPDYVPPHQRQIGNQPQVGQSVWPAFPASSDTSTDKGRPAAAAAQR